MAKLSLPRRILKLFHPEGIPWPGSLFYNLGSSTDIFQRAYEVIARDILSYCSTGALLDIGTGPGWLLLKLHKQAPQMHLIGMDVSPSMVARAKDNIAAAGLADAIEIREGSASQIPFPDNLLDVVISTASIHHWKEPTIGISEIYRVLKPGSYALLYDVVSDLPQEVLKDMRHEYGGLPTWLFWLHGFEEPFYSQQVFARLAEGTAFKTGQTKFVSVLDCLVLQKPDLPN